MPKLKRKNTPKETNNTYLYSDDTRAVMKDEEIHQNVANKIQQTNA